MLRECGSARQHGVRNGRLQRPPQTEHGGKIRPPDQPVDHDRTHARPAKRRMRHRAQW